MPDPFDPFARPDPYAPFVAETDRQIKELGPRISKLQDQAFKSDDFSLADGLSTAFLGLLPGLVGYAAGGYSGGALGGAVGASAVGGYAENLAKENEKNRTRAGLQLKTAQEELDTLNKNRRDYQIKGAEAGVRRDEIGYRDELSDKNAAEKFGRDQKLQAIQHGYRVAEKGIQSADSIAADRRKEGGNVEPTIAERKLLLDMLQASNGDKPLDADVQDAVMTADGAQLARLAKLTTNDRTRDVAERGANVKEAGLSLKVALAAAKADAEEAAKTSTPEEMEAARLYADGQLTPLAANPKVRQLAATLISLKKVEAQAANAERDDTRADSSLDLARQREQRMAANDTARQKVAVAKANKTMTPDEALVVEKVIDSGYESLTPDEFGKLTANGREIVKGATSQQFLANSEKFAGLRSRGLDQSQVQQDRTGAQIAARVSPRLEMIEPGAVLTQDGEKKTRKIVQASDEIDKNLREMERLLSNGRDWIQGNSGQVDAVVARLQGSIRDLLNTGARLEGKEGEMVQALAGVSVGTEGVLATTIKDIRKDPVQTARYVRKLLRDTADTSLGAYGARLKPQMEVSAKPKLADFGGDYAAYIQAAEAYKASKGN